MVVALAPLAFAAGLKAQRAPAPAALDTVLAHIDRAAAGIDSLAAQVISLKYTKVVDDATVEKGDFYFQKTRQGPQIALDITKPYRRLFIYRDDTGWIYQPQIKQAQEFDLRRNRAAVTQFLLLGLGGGGHALEQSFDVALEPSQRGNAFVHLHLTPKRNAASASIASIDLWYDPSLWIAVAQQVNQPSGDYQRLDYSHIKINPHISASHFATNFPGARIVRPQEP